MKSLNVSDRSIQYVRSRVQELMTSRVSVYPRGETVLNDETGIVETVFRNPAYTGKARIWESNSGATLVQGDAAITLMQTNISIPFDSYVPTKDEIVKVIECPQDPDLVGRSFRVMAVDGNGQIGAVRRMTCSAYTESAVWE